MPSRQPFALAAFAASIFAHATLAALLVWNVGDDERDEEPDMVVDVDLDIAPAAPEGFDPLDPSATTLVEEPAGPETAETEETEDPSAGATVEPEPEPVDQEKEPGEDEAKAEDEAEEDPDEEPPEKELAGKDGPLDAGPPADGGAALAENASDGGPASASPFAEAAAAIARTGSTIPSAPASTIADATTGSARDAKPIRLPPGASADLRMYAPQNDKIAVLLRYDRLRGTPWAQLADAIIAPMPDYRSIVGHRKVALADLFQSLLISSRNPTNVVATNLVARTHLSAAEVRRFLDHPLQPVTWQAVRGGALGQRESSELKPDRDRRVYLMPTPGLVVLTAPKHLGVLTEQATPAGPARSDLDSVRAAEADLPGWLSRARSVENEAGVDSDVIAVVTVGGLKRAEIPVPDFGAVPSPVRFSLALEMAKVGFYVRGTLAFATPELAQEFETRIDEGRKRVLGNRFTQLMLRNLHAFHALQGLTLRRRGQLVTYATSISNADAKAAMGLAAEWARRFFEAPPEESAPPDAGTAPNGAAPGGANGAAPRGVAPPAGGQASPGRAGTSARPRPAPGSSAGSPGPSRPAPSPGPAATPAAPAGRGASP